jgi:DNA invertase Pin-like site-specific DNA recombinase
LVLVPDRYDDGGFSGGTLERPALKRLLADIEAGRIDVVVVYKIDRLSRALMDFSRLVEVFDRHWRDRSSPSRNPSTPRPAWDV